MSKQSIYLPNNVKRKPHIIEILPWAGKGTSTALYPYIWLAGNVYDDLLSSTPDPYSIALLLHEQEHISRMKIERPFKWAVKYMLVRSFRFNEELAALHPQFQVLKKNGLDPNIEFRAKRLSSWLYFWPIPYTVAVSRLKDLWEEIL